ncbi:MAG: nucleoside hydrolase [Acidobacteriia bacterium]|nr:nucleoside hydrolase [Terriglobia bacterium]
MPIPVILDCDPGHDDAIAILLAGASPELDVRGITTVAGNVSVDKTSKNALKICELAKLDRLKVYAGMSRPLVKDLLTAENVHGRSGLDGPELPEPKRTVEPRHAIDFLIDELLSSKEPVTLIPTAPLTNIAAALIREPRIRTSIQEIVMMGGAIAEGNTTPAAEFNIYVDPHAADVVFRSGVPIWMIGLDVTHQALVLPERLKKIRALGSPVSAAAADLMIFFQEHHRVKYGMEGPPLHDPCAVAAVIDRSIFRFKEMHVGIELEGRLTQGRTVCDLWNVTGNPPNAHVGLSVDAPRFFDLLISRLARYGKW